MKKLLTALLALAFIIPSAGCFHRRHGGDKVIVVPPGKVKPLPPGQLKKLNGEPASEKNSLSVPREI